MYLYIYIYSKKERGGGGESYLNKLVDTVVEANKSEIAGQAGRLESQERAGVLARVWRLSGGRIPASPGDLSLFFLKVFNWLNEACLQYEG